MTKDEAIKKIQLLLALAKSSNPNEAANAQSGAEKLIEKFSLQTDDYAKAEAPAYDTRDNLLFEELILTEWRAIIAIACANKYDCVVIREDATATIASEVSTTYRYFVYGDDSDIIHVKLCCISSLFPRSRHCWQPNALARAPYTSNHMPRELLMASRTTSPTSLSRQMALCRSSQKPRSKCKSGEAIVKTGDALAVPEPPVKKTTTINTQDKPIDYVAYIRGQRAGSQIHIGEPREEDLVLGDRDVSLPPSVWDKVKGLFSRKTESEDWDDDDDWEND